MKKEQSECATVKGVKEECVKSKLLLEDTTGRQYQDCYRLLLVMLPNAVAYILNKTARVEYKDLSKQTT